MKGIRNRIHKSISSFISHKVVILIAGFLLIFTGCGGKTTDLIIENVSIITANQVYAAIGHDTNALMNVNNYSEAITTGYNVTGDGTIQFSIEDYNDKETWLMIVEDTTADGVVNDGDRMFPLYKIDLERNQQTFISEVEADFTIGAAPYDTLLRDEAGNQPFYLDIKAGLVKKEEVTPAAPVYLNLGPAPDVSAPDISIKISDGDLLNHSVIWIAQAAITYMFIYHDLNGNGTFDSGDIASELDWTLTNLMYDTNNTDQGDIYLSVVLP